MAFVTTGLTNGGVTTHFNFQYDDSISNTIEPARTNAVIAAIEGDYNLMFGWFGGSVSLSNQTVQVTTQGGGASWSGGTGGATIQLKPGNNTAANFLRYLIVAEVTEIFMLGQNQGWFQGGDEGSKGEGLSRFLSAQFLVANGLLGSGLQGGFDVARFWLNSTRQDFVNNAPDDNAPDATNGCTTLFIYYLFAQLGFSIPQIVAAAADTLAGVYANLTGDHSDPFPFFKAILDNAFPSTTSSVVPGQNRDNPYPLALLSFWVDKSTFGRDEVTDVIASSSHGTFPNAFWLVLEGMNIQSFNALSVANPALSGPFKNLPQVGISLNSAGREFELPGNTLVPQRIRFPYDVTFATATLTSFPAAGSSPVFETLNASISAGGAAIPGAAASTEFELVGGADPYFTNIDPTQNNVFYLSQDLRVFTGTPATSQHPVAGAPAFASDSVAGAYSYIQSVLGFLNDPSNHFTDGTHDPFSNGVIPGQGQSLSADSSVTPFSISLFPFFVRNNYNFAICRVRLRGTAGPAGAADNVKVFFRMWSTQTADTGFEPSTYPSVQTGGHPEWPLPAADNHTIPFFATGNSPNMADPNNPEYGTSGVNNRTIQIPSGDSVWAYYGCFLNVYDPANTVNGTPVQAALAGTHHCLVAEIAYDGAPIVNTNGVTESPENSDKLAQRNLQVTHSDNPGPPETHRVPQTFDIKPGPAIAATPGLLLNYPDELMIDWGKTPAGSKAQIYWPKVDAMKVLNLASNLYGTHLLTAADGHTIECTTTKGVTYVPIPPGTGENLASLLTIDLPPSVRSGQEYNITVRRVATRRQQEIPTPKIARRHIESVPEGKQPRAAAAPEASTHGPLRNWRYIVGTFQVKIPVTTKEVMLRPDEDALAIFKWRLGAISSTNRWRPVFERYIEYLSARIKGLGGNPDGIPPSPKGAPVNPPHEGGKPHAKERTGRVIEVIYDCFGDFEGFVLGDCCERWTIRNCERGIGELIARACRERLLVTVVEEDCHGEHHIRRIVTRC